ncbi:MAG: tRNA preQ1(34) S-adenosylmethionine ribosyltransferase-isomerase QueA [Nevskiaceae bacterium]|nr:MAG: tRNA preQ1(34) S-adenosylmethionine ribosyltransferase-isomerase QueA [Nevskiaceae bacterium]TBR72694.1 MAG: tRNA preQ1(34) S-adenosylmethionine ribosyltransferase-isomerase QueA [Nevskiaceae bacterium]
MLRSDFDYALPLELIAQHPPEVRGTSRLLCVDEAGLRDRHMGEFPAELRAGDLLVLNDTRVIPARLHGRKASGGKVEVMIERYTGTHTAVAQLRVSKSPHAGTELVVDGARLAVEGREHDMYRLRLVAGADSFDALLARAGEVPLPPYITHTPDAADVARYQTVYAKNPGAVAAPTAGLHFTEALLQQVRDRGVDIGFTTLHVGAGTFQPVREDDVSHHHMHSERAFVSPALVAQVQAARARGGRVVAVGTTVVRSLEAAAVGGTLQPFHGETDLFIVPGFEFHVVDALLTNFHLPQSTLLMLVCAFAGYDRMLAAYRHAVAEEYAFFSYGDATWLPFRCDSKNAMKRSSSQ